MRILALKPEGYVIPFIHASMVKAFRSLGHEVINLPFPKGLREIRTLKPLASKGRSCFFSLDLPRDEEMREILNDLHIILKNHWIIWFVDDPHGFAFPECCEPSRTIVFCWDGELTREIGARGSWKGIPPIHLPLASDPGVFTPGADHSPMLFPGGVFVGSTAHPNRILDEAIMNSPGFEEEILALWKLWKSDLSQVGHKLIGNFLEEKKGIPSVSLPENPLACLWAHSAAHALGRIKRKEIVSAVIGEGGGVFGNRAWKEIAGNIYCGEAFYGPGLSRIYNASSFVLETRQAQSRTGLTQRIFDAAACSVPVLAEHSPELNEFFDLEDAVFSFRTINEALERKKEILSLPKHNRNAPAPRNRILANHTYRHRAARILEAVHHFFAASRA
jgi:spore maturation protein CgeB